MVSSVETNKMEAPITRQVFAPWSLLAHYDTLTPIGDLPLVPYLLGLLALCPNLQQVQFVLIILQWFIL